MRWTEVNTPKGLILSFLIIQLRFSHFFVATLGLTFSVLYKPLYQQRKYSAIKEDNNVRVIIREGGRGHWTVNHTGTQSLIFLVILFVG